jgi:formylmethanofuran dehydrogenase subunit E
VNNASVNTNKEIHNNKPHTLIVNKAKKSRHRDIFEWKPIKNEIRKEITKYTNPAFEISCINFEDYKKGKSCH